MSADWAGYGRLKERIQGALVKQLAGPIYVFACPNIRPAQFLRRLHPITVNCRLQCYYLNAQQLGSLFRTHKIFHFNSRKSNQLLINLYCLSNRPPPGRATQIFRSLSDLFQVWNKSIYFFLSKTLKTLYFFSFLILQNLINYLLISVVYLIDRHTAVQQKFSACIGAKLNVIYKIIS